MAKRKPSTKKPLVLRPEGYYRREGDERRWLSDRMVNQTTCTHVPRGGTSCGICGATGLPEPRLAHT